jgi:uncharacterized SAM-binding protein YcdF (DUF218 family)
MEYLLSKLLPLFVYPLGLSILLVFFGLMLMSLGHRRKSAVSFLLAMAILWINSTNVFSGYVLSSLEQRYPPIPIEHLPNAGAIVVLGGYTDASSSDGVIELGDAIDRLFHGMRLYRAGKAPRVILAGGAARGHKPEAQVMADMLAEFGISRDVMLLEGKSRNTRENAVNALALMQANKINKILLVTSAFHMHRAQAVFEKLGLEVVPAATDYQVLEPDPSILDWLPNAEALMMTTLGIKEYLGWWVYKFRGWV